jgi:hypothetical protein
MLLLCRAEILSIYNNRRNTVKATLIGWFPRTTTALLLVSDNHLPVAKSTLATAASSWQMCSM